MVYLFFKNFFIFCTRTGIWIVIIDRSFKIKKKEV